MDTDVEITGIEHPGTADYAQAGGCVPGGILDALQPRRVLLPPRAGGIDRALPGGGETGGGLGAVLNRHPGLKQASKLDDAHYNGEQGQDNQGKLDHCLGPF